MTQTITTPQNTSIINIIPMPQAPRLTDEHPTMSIGNPLAESPATDPEDRALVLRAKSGDRAALEEPVRRHQAWIYSIDVRMLYHPQDAEDATQEILVKALTALSSYEGRSSFRTWLYRIVVNHVLNAKRGGWSQG